MVTPINRSPCAARKRALGGRPLRYELRIIACRYHYPAAGPAVGVDAAGPELFTAYTRLTVPVLS